MSWACLWSREASTGPSSTRVTSCCSAALVPRSRQSSRSTGGRWATARSESSRRSCSKSISAPCAARHRNTWAGRSPFTSSRNEAAMKIIVAPNSFKGSLSATQAAIAIARGVRRVFPDAEVVEIPVADGGDGTVEALVAARKGVYRWANVEGPLGDPVLSPFGLLDDGLTAVVELASASGYELIQPARRDPRKTSTFGFGQLLEAARQAGAKSIIAGIGGSATNDGGTGMPRALGYRL